MSIAGETIDYGPCAFMDAYHPETVFSSIDRLGRYAYGKQPQIAGWNLARLGEALMPLFDDGEEKALEQANESLKRYGDLFGAAYLGGLRRKFGFFTERDDDDKLVQGFLKLLMDNGIDYTLAFRRLSKGEMPVEDADWAARYRARLALEPQDEATRRAAMQAVNPLYIPRNHRVEAALNAAIESDDYGPFEELLTVLARPFEERAQFATYAEPPSEDDRRNFRTY
jgi:serine/tyrosine/threonine adenylyltransferase